MINSHLTKPVLEPPSVRLPVVWCIGGVDSSGGAGITRDAITLADSSAHACVLTTQITVQSNQQLLSKDSMSASALNQQWQVLYEDTPPRAIKIGAIANDEQALLLCARIHSLIKPRPFVIWDPVQASSSGGMLSDLSESVVDELLNTVDLVTPNIDELAWLSNLPVNDDTSLASAINRLIGKGAKSVYVKGGHAEWQTQVYDTFVCASHTLHFSQPIINNGKLRGTGCMLASAIAAFIVNDYCIEDALTLANAYVCEVRRNTLCEPDADSAKAHDNGANLPTYFPRTNGFPTRAASFPKVNFHQGSAVFYNKDLCPESLSNGDLPSESVQGNVARFPTLTHTNLGIYPVVDSVQWIARLWPTGAKIIQLRVKEGSQQDIRQQIKDAIELVEHTNCQLFINDYWELAIELGAVSYTHLTLPTILRV